MKIFSRNSGFVIDGMTRTGSTTLARVLNCHPEINCLMEPFHPRRYQGQFNQMTLSTGSVSQALSLIWHRWTGIKHVWEADTGWPFIRHPEFNDEIVLAGGPVIFLRRRNLLRRYVSSVISRRLTFWVGTRDEFLTRLEEKQLPELVPSGVRSAIERDFDANEQRVRLLNASGIRWLAVFYEDLYDESLTADRRRLIINSILQFLGFESMDEDTFRRLCLPLLNPEAYRWASADVYLRIPGILDVEREAGSDCLGWVFKNDFIHKSAG